MNNRDVVNPDLIDESNVPCVKCGRTDKYLFDNGLCTECGPGLEPGCYFDGARGYEAQAELVIALAIEYGMDDPDDGTNGQDRDNYSDTQDRDNYDVDDEFEDETLMENEQAATQYLEDFAPEGHWVGWNDGDFGVWEDEEEFDGDDFLHPGDSTEEDDPYHNG